jgi:hypothetical protein
MGDKFSAVTDEITLGVLRISVESGRNQTLCGPRSVAGGKTSWLAALCTSAALNT